MQTAAYVTTCIKNMFRILKAALTAAQTIPGRIPEYAVFRCPSGKWFALIMKIRYRQLGLNGEEEVFVVNLKATPEDIPQLTDKKSVFPAWHMNKKHWITVLLTAATDFDSLCRLTERSFELVNGK